MNDEKKDNKIIDIDKALGFIYTDEKAKRKGSDTFKVAGTLVRATSKSAERNLFSAVEDTQDAKLNAKYTNYKSQNALFTELCEGVQGGDLVYKILIALSNILYEQSEAVGTTATMTGARGKMQDNGLPVGDRAVRIREDDKEESLYANITIVYRDFAKLVCGGRTVGGKDIKKIRNVLEELDKKYILFDFGNGQKLFVRPLSIEAYLKDENNPNLEAAAIQLKPIFTRSIKNDYVIMRKDTLQLFGGHQKEMTMRLFFYLSDMHRHKESAIYPHFRISKDKLFEMIAAPSERYTTKIKTGKMGADGKPVYKIGRRKKLLESDWKDAVQKMIEVGIITQCSQETGITKDIIHFVFNTDYTKKRKITDILAE